uniref:Uncharacterized protein n=1 Tax=viral metagenome TaxID=1070528 RepID=A0A6C0ARQ2_9ZZZZ
MSKVAIIYTGETRTIETTIQYFKNNVLLNSNYHVFGVVQSDNIEHHNHIIRETIGYNLKHLTWFDKNNPEWITLRENQIQKMHITDRWKDYLKTSGSMIEYYQMYLAYQSLEKYEIENNIKYDFVLRFRTDTVLKDSIDFDTIFEKTYIQNILYEIKDILSINTIISEEILDIFMNSFYSKNRILYKNCDVPKILVTDQLNKLLEISDEYQFIEELIIYLKNGNYMISFRKNLIYFLRRDLMNYIHVLGITYGDYLDEKNSYWFDAESQLENICARNNIDKFNSTTELEGNSLYNYQHLNYYNENGELKQDNYSFFIKRY